MHAHNTTQKYNSFTIMNISIHYVLVLFLLLLQLFENKNTPIILNIWMITAMSVASARQGQSIRADELWSTVSSQVQLHLGHQHSRNVAKLHTIPYQLSSTNARLYALNIALAIALVTDIRNVLGWKSGGVTAALSEVFCVPSSVPPGNADISF
jgi:hypothetical protein